jgi:hypothetical protein
MSHPKVKITDKGWDKYKETLVALRAEQKKRAYVGILAADANTAKRLSDMQKARYAIKQSGIRKLLAPIRQARIEAKRAGDKEAHAMATAYVAYGKQRITGNATAHKAAKTALTVLQVAQWMEFGTDDTVARPFVRGYADKYGKKVREIMGEAAKAALTRRNVDAAKRILQMVGAIATGGTQMFITNQGEGTYLPNAGSTIAEKGSDTPLVDTGQLRSSITFVVRWKAGT